MQTLNTTARRRPLLGSTDARDDVIEIRAGKLTLTIDADAADQREGAPVAALAGIPGKDCLTLDDLRRLRAVLNSPALAAILDGAAVNATAAD